MFTLDAGVAYAIGNILSNFARHAARRQLYVPLDVLDRHAINREEIFASQASAALRAALAEMRNHARQHLAAAQAKLSSVPAEILPGLLPVALVGPALYRMERRNYDPFRPELLPAWRRQWLLWRAARDPGRIFRV
jgi:phytoene synthase